MAAAKQLYYSNDEIRARFKPSLSNYFDVFISANFDGINSKFDNEINFLAYEAVLPGTSYQTTEVFGDRQGITETFANKRVYPPVDISFYVDNDYDVLRFFESWMKYISPNLGKSGSTDSYQKFKYPQNNYKKEIVITKFERNFRRPNQRLVKAGVYGPPENYCTYNLKNAYPVNLISVPVSYDGTNLLRTTVTFNYDVYSFNRKKEDEINKPAGDNSFVEGPGRNQSPTPPQIDPTTGLVIVRETNGPTPPR